MSLPGFLGPLMGIGPVRRQSLIGVATFVGTTAVGYLATAYFAHTLGPAPLGTLYLLISVSAILAQLTDWGLSSAAAQKIGEGEERDAYFSAHACVRLLLLLPVLLLVVFGMPFLPGKGEGVLPGWGFAAALLLTLVGITTAGLTGSAKVGILRLTEFLGNLVKLGVQVIAVVLGYATAGLLGGFLAGLVATVLLSVPSLEVRPVRFGWHHLRGLWWYAGWVSLGGFVGVLGAYADTLLIGFFLTRGDVGIYRGAVQFATIALFASIALRATLYPRIVVWYRAGELGMVSAALSRALTYSLLIAVPCAVGGTLLAGPILYYLYGEIFAPAAPALVLLLAAQVVSVWADLPAVAISACGRPDLAVRIPIGGAVVLLVADLALIPSFGIVGGAMGLLLSQVAAAVIAHRMSWDVTRVRFEIAPVCHILIATMAMALVVGTFSAVVMMTHLFFVVAAVALGAAIYFTVLFRLDRGIYAEIRDIFTALGFVKQVRRKRGV
jgi:O-antigen/teichoic acid export membrane protein